MLHKRLISELFKQMKLMKTISFTQQHLMWCLESHLVEPGRGLKSQNMFFDSSLDCLFGPFIQIEQPSLCAELFQRSCTNCNSILPCAFG